MGVVEDTASVLLGAPPRCWYDASKTERDTLVYLWVFMHGRFSGV